jgi:hypothetical protein
MPNTRPSESDDLRDRSPELFRAMVESVGVKKFSTDMGLTTRQINRMLSGAQPNPVERVLRSLQSSEPEVGDRVLDYLCQEMGGHFVRHEGNINDAAVNAVRESAEAIAAISDGNISPIDEQQIREAIGALIALSRKLQEDRGGEVPAKR